MRRLLILAATMLFASCTGDRPRGSNPVHPSADNPPIASLALSGVVVDTAGRPLQEALVEILNGPHGGATTITGGDGRYSFDQTFDRVPALRASKPGFRSDSSNVWVSATSTITGWFVLASHVPPIDLTGSYLLTFTVDPACRVPDPAARRTYQTEINGNLLRHTITLSGAQFVPSESGNGNVIYLHVSEDYVSFHFTESLVWESIGPESIKFFGDAQGTVSNAAEFSLPMWARVQYCRNLTAGRACSGEITCESTQNVLTLFRR